MMTDTDIIIEVAKLDGWTPHYNSLQELHKFSRDGVFVWVSGECKGFNYLTSRDAIIPVIEKTFSRLTAHSFIDALGILRSEDTLDCDGKVEYQGDGSYGEIWLLLTSTARHLCIALLKATGKWKD